MFLFFLSLFFEHFSLTGFQSLLYSLFSHYTPRTIPSQSEVLTGDRIYSMKSEILIFKHR